MKRLFSLLPLAACLALSGCGSTNQAAAVRRTVQTYWYDIGHAHLDQAYHLMTTGNQATRTYSAYTQDMFGFLQHTSGISARVGTPSIHGNFAVVDVWLHSPAAAGEFHAYQHLFLENGHWRISDANGGLSQTK